VFEAANPARASRSATITAVEFEWLAFPERIVPLVRWDKIRWQGTQNAVVNTRSGPSSRCCSRGVAESDLNPSIQGYTHNLRG
jgi:hypothetical protein